MNVAITRAKKKVYIVTSFDPSESRGRFIHSSYKGARDMDSGAFLVILDYYTINASLKNIYVYDAYDDYKSSLSY